MKRFWISWVETSQDYRPLTYPPQEPIRGWWVSGQTDDGVTICAVIDAPSELDAYFAIQKDWPCESPDFRFADEKEPTFVPDETRFPPSDWMVERLNNLASAS